MVLFDFLNKEKELEQKGAITDGNNDLQRALYSMLSKGLTNIYEENFDTWKFT